jgi:Xaa-Pro dipeptidase
VFLATDGRYLEQAAGQAPDFEVVDSRKPALTLLDRAKGRVAFEDETVSVAEYGTWAGQAVELVGLGSLLRELRIPKDEYEMRQLRAACEITDDAFAQMLDEVRLGWTEQQIALRLETLMRSCGAEDRAFDSIVAAGPNGSRPHHSPTDRPVAAGEFVTCDLGARVNGYHADMTRTFLLGKHGADWQDDVYQIVRAAQRVGRQALVPGVPAREVDAVTRQVMVSSGLGDAFPHSTGHGVGLEIHEPPLLGATGTGTIPGSSAVTVEPGAYLPGLGGVRIEDTLIVHRDGPELLTRTSKELLVV